MSFDLFFFERRNALKTSLDVFAYFDKFTEYDENRDYNSLDGCSDAVAEFAKKMFLKFPPMNGAYAPPDEIAYASEESESHLCDYSIGEHGIYCAFSYSVDEEALAYAKTLSDQSNIGIYNPQSNDAFYAKGLEILKCRTEQQSDMVCDRENVEHFLETLDDKERGTSNRDSAFLTLWFEKDGTEVPYIQCTPNYNTRGFLNRLFKGRDSAEISGYFFEIEKDGSLYQTLLQDKEALTKTIKEWCFERTEPDISDYQKIMDL